MWRNIADFFWQEGSLVELCESKKEDLELFCQWEQTEDTREYIIPYNLKRHLEEFAKKDIIYLSIRLDADVAGFVILKLEDDLKSVEFRRIVVNEKGQGVGQVTLREIDRYCYDKLKRERIWLDVFSFNVRGIHIYEKYGYQRVGEAIFAGQKLFIYEKWAWFRV